jgi:uncharacterized RDD family membrane protein YckC
MATADASARVMAERGAEASLRPGPRAAVAREAGDGSPYSGLVTRTIAVAVDLAAINVVALVAGGVVTLSLSLFPISASTQSTMGAVGAALFAVWWIVYFVGFWITTGVTLGNYVMRIRVVREDGARLHLGRALLRVLGAVLGLPLFVGYVPILLNDRRRGLQDVLGGTVVINQQRGTDP